MQPIKEIILDIFKGLSEKNRAEKDIVEVWRTVAGEEFHKTDIACWKGGVLKIHVDSPARLFKLNLRKAQLVEEIKKEIDSVEQIIFKVGKTSKTGNKL